MTGTELFNGLRYSVSNVNLTGLQLTSKLEIFKSNNSVFDIVIDDDIKLDDVRADYIFNVFNNQSFNGMVMNPLGNFNDGLNELCFSTAGLGVLQKKALVNQLKDGARHMYSSSFNTYRFKKMKITNKTKDNRGELVTQHLFVDKMPLSFKKTLEFEVVPKAINIIGDYQRILDRNFLLSKN